MHLYCITKGLVCYLQWFWLRQHSPKDKYLILLKSNSHCLKLFCKPNNSVKQPVFITKTCFLYQPFVLTLQHFQFSTLCTDGTCQKCSTPKACSYLLTISFKIKELITVISKFSSQILNKTLICLTKVQGKTNVNMITAKQFKLCTSYPLMV